MHSECLFFNLKACVRNYKLGQKIKFLPHLSFNLSYVMFSLIRNVADEISYVIAKVFGCRGAQIASL